MINIRDSILRLAVGISGGAVNISDMLLLGIGCFLREPKYRVGELGKLEEITYRRSDGELCTHKFHRPPILSYSQTSLFILNHGSKFNVKDGVGIVEAEDIPEKSKRKWHFQ